jgi:hypothetical protein
MSSSGGVEQTLESVLAELHQISDASPDIADMEPVLLRLREYLRMLGPHTEAEAFMVRLVDTWPQNAREFGGIVEALEFTMRDLRWEGVRAALLRLVDSDADFRVKDLARHALEVYEEDWRGGEIYATYRDEVPPPTRPSRWWPWTQRRGHGDSG